MSDRRYSDDEVAAIFARATEVQDREPKAVARIEGMSLGELQAIGKEAGISTDLIARAARELDQPAPPRVPTLLGIPIGASHTVELPRELTDREWELFVVQLRETFDARGKVSSHGSFRQWSNGNLQVLVEPNARGHRVRFRTVQGQLRDLFRIGVPMAAAVALTSLMVSFTAPEKALKLLTVLGPLLAVGGVVGGLRLFGLGGWRRLRTEQMQRLSASLLELTSASDSSHQG